jgi:predicted nucleic acid-binding protein
LSNSALRYLVTRDNDLLDLQADEEFHRTFPDTTILDPVSFLQIARAQAP